ncbi:Ig-like domain-containing protein, partial [Mycobacterium sp.]|uniref:Ig-like domain-containing protein n=1 Tax=Mycobacterium sp. TaxID=1785 RepID=UPI002D8310D9|nr:Ig-like domain-containing protein [Mycobacterium sp.]
ADTDGDSLTYAVSTPAGKGSITMTGPGQFTYTPTYAARHAAAATTATTADKQDTFTITINDGHGGQTTTTVTVSITPANSAPNVTVNPGTPNTTTGVVTGTITATDADGDPLTYTGSTTTTKGSVTVNANGTFTYTPTAAARHAASATGATTADKQDTFTITVTDGYGATVSVPVTVAIGPANAVPNATANPGAPNTTTGVVTGTITATDADGDSLTYTGSTTTTKGSVTVNANGTFTYTPTAAARHAASADNAAATGATSDTFTITVTDGHGASVTIPVTVSISPTNIAPTVPNQTAGVRTPFTGTGFYHVVGSDADGDALTFTVTTQALHGTILNSGSGVLTYTPNMSYYAGMTTASDTFVITVNDGHGGTVTQVLTYNWSPLTTPTNSINTSNTTVGFADSDLYFMSQADINRTLDTMQAMGVNNVRMIIPWAGVEGTKDVYTWGTIDYIVNAAYQRNIGVVAVLNTTPTWAATPGQPLYAGAPIAVDQYAEFAGLVAARYAGKISAYEIWNEPNAYFFWSPQPDPAAYTVLLQAAFPAIKAADPNATVIAGVLGSIPDWGNLYMNPITYLDQMYDAGAHGYFDAISFHPYHYTLKFSEGLPWWNLSPINQLTMMHDLMVANGDGDKKIWSTEYGVPTAVASEATQAEFIEDYLNAWSQFDYTGPTFFYSTRDTDTDSGFVDYTFGLLRDDWTYKLAGYIAAEWAATHPQLTSVEVLL